MNTFRMFCVLFVIAATVTFVPASTAQDTLDQHYDSTSHGVHFSYSSTWKPRIYTTHPDYVRMAFKWGASVMQIRFYAPRAVERMSEDAENIRSVATGLMDELGHEEVRMIRLGTRTAAEALVDDWQYLFVAFSDGRFGLVSASMRDHSIAEQRDFVKSIARTYSEMQTAAMSVAPQEEPIQLVNYAGNYREVMAELESLRLVASGSTLVFEEEYAFLESAGHFAVPVGRRSPRTNVVMSAEIRMSGMPRFGKFNFERGCGIMARITTIDDGDIIGGVEAALFPSNTLVLIDFNNPSRNFWDNEFQFDHTATNSLLMILHEDEASIFVNGTPATDEPIHVREVSGMYALNSASEGDFRCEWRNIWVVEIPEFEEGVCEAISLNGANLRAGPGTDFERSGSLSSNTPQPTSGYALAADGYKWYHLDTDAWVREDLIYLRGDCTNLPQQTR